MKTLVKVLKVEDNTVYYAEICKKDGHVMIEDCMAEDRFQSATSKEGDFGFIVVTEDSPKVKKSTKMIRIAAGTDLDGAPACWGRVTLEISASSEQIIDNIVEGLKVEGWGSNNTFCGDENSIIYMVDSSDLLDFKASYKDVKKEVLKG